MTSGDFDDETTRFFDSGVANADFFASGNYLFADVIDIGAKHMQELQLHYLNLLTILMTYLTTEVDYLIQLLQTLMEIHQLMQMHI